MVSSLDDEFRSLEARVRELISLLEEEEERFWISYFERGLKQLEGNRLSGATFILGCYGGVETFSDYTIGERWRQADPLRYRNLNARLGHLRTQTFEAANAITARRSW